MESYEQSLSRKQRQSLEDLVGLTPHLVHGVIFLVHVVLVGAVLRALQHLVLTSPPLWMAATTALAIWLYYRAGRWTGGSALRRLIRRDLEAGHALVKVVDAVCVEKVEEEEDEGPSYVIMTPEGETCLFCGQSLYEYEDRGFPWVRIGVVQTPYSESLLELQPLGEPIAVSQLLAPFTHAEARDLGCLQAEFVQLDKTKLALLEQYRKRVAE
jgi:hypothetical protein